MVELRSFIFIFYLFIKKKLDTKKNVLLLQETYSPTEAPDGRISAALAAETDNLDPGSDSEVTEDKKAAELSEKVKYFIRVHAVNEEFWL